MQWTNATLQQWHPAAARYCSERTLPARTLESEI